MLELYAILDNTCLGFPDVVFYSVITELIVGFMIPGTSLIRIINADRIDPCGCRQAGCDDDVCGFSCVSERLYLNLASSQI